MCTENKKCSNPEQHRTTTQKTQIDQPKKKKKTRTSTYKTLTDQPRKHKPTTENIPSENQPRKKKENDKRQTKLENTKNEPLVLRSTNPSCFSAKIVNFRFEFSLRFRDRDFWVWDFEKRVCMFEEGEEEKGRTV